MRVAVNTASASSPRRRWTGGADDKCRGAPLLTLMHAELPLGKGGIQSATTATPSGSPRRYYPPAFKTGEGNVLSQRGSSVIKTPWLRMSSGVRSSPRVTPNDERRGVLGIAPTLPLRPHPLGPSPDDPAPVKRR